uniref:ADP-ribosylation factor n=1 Tax=Arcella intermedia TaxID=1963864 RepID=A0A6B2LLI4_9EUKA
MFIKKEYKILMVGLDAPGKTTILYKLKLGDIVTTIPTIGFNVETISLHSRNYTLWDVGGPDKIRALWRHYYEGIDATIFVIDANDVQRLEEAIFEWKRLAYAVELANVPSLIFANKQDLPGALPPEEIESMMGITARYGRFMHVQGSIATQGVGLAEGFAWLNSALDALGK